MINLREIKNKIIIKNNIYWLFAILIIFFLDRYSKIFILNNFTENTYYLNDYINLDLVWNIGIGFGLLSTDTSLIYNIITFVIGVVIIILLFLLLTAQTIEKIVYSMIMGGALGNFYDRLVYSAVPDFIDLHYKNFHWFTFNVADIFISMGIVFFILKSYFVKDSRR